MWKRIDNDFYNTLIAAHRYDYAPDYFTFPFIFLLLRINDVSVNLITPEPDVFSQ